MPSQDEVVVVNLRIPAHVCEALDARARADRRSRTAQVVHVLERYLAAEVAPEPWQRGEAT